MMPYDNPLRVDQCKKKRTTAGGGVDETLCIEVGVTSAVAY